jgi:alpha-N-arabinofuranosidase
MRLFTILVLPLFAMAQVVFAVSVAQGVRDTASATPDATPAIHIDVGHSLARVSPLHAGLMTEEINHSYDGGLYGELIRDRALSESVVPKAKSLGPWTLVGAGPGAGLALEVGDSVSEAVPTSLRINAVSASVDHRVGVANGGYWGMPVYASARYRVSFYGELEGRFTGPLVVSMESLDGSQTYGRVEVPLSAGSWKRYEAVLTTAAGIHSTSKARVVIYAEHPGTFRLTLISVFAPTWNDRVNGNRVDLMQKLVDLHPKFLRFPGGNYLEGDTVASRFDWKRTVGDLSLRHGHASPWGYESTDGIGLLEFMLWCEELKAEPVLGVYAGLSMKEPPIPAGPKLVPFVQDALDEIEYLTGDVTTPWGARRARDGHPRPFKLTYVEVGNEDNLHGPSGYERRFATFYDAIKARYPAIQLIATTPVKSRRPDVLDEHFYRSADDFFQDVDHYDGYDRNGPKIFVGEWATMEGSPTPNLHAALADAAWMVGMERNADVVIMQAYAPLLVNINRGAYQWETNLIGYDALQSYGSPSYYAQVMFNTHRGNEILTVTGSSGARLFTSATRDSQTGTVYLKAVNATAEPRVVRIELAGISGVGPSGSEVVLQGNPQDTNTIEGPEKIVPKESVLLGLTRNFEHVFPAHSVSVIEVQQKGIKE